MAAEKTGNMAHLETWGVSTVYTPYWGLIFWGCTQNFGGVTTLCGV